MSLTRRQALELAGAFLVAACGPMRAVTTTGRVDDALPRWLETHMGDVDAAGVAAAWRARHPNEASPAALASAIVAGRRPGELIAPYLARTVAAEHAAGGAERFDGWYLAPTEARLLALVHASLAPGTEAGGLPAGRRSGADVVAPPAGPA